MSRRRNRWLAAGAVLALAASVVLALRADGEARKRASARERAADVLGEPQVVADPGVFEPSGVAFDARRGRLFVVGDEGHLAQLDPKGSRLQTVAAPVQVEDVAVMPDGSLLLVRELGGELILVDAETGREKRRWRLDTAALLGRGRGLDANAGFEGLAFRAGANGAGVLYLVHQRSPAAVVAVGFDPAGPGGRVGAEAVQSRWDLEHEGDLTAATWVPSLERVVVIADARDRLLVLDPRGAVEASIPLPGLQQEGLTFDDEGALWVADDRAGRLMRFPGALERIGAALRAHSTEPK